MQNENQIFINEIRVGCDHPTSIAWSIENQNIESVLDDFKKCKMWLSNVLETGEGLAATCVDWMQNMIYLDLKLAPAYVWMFFFHVLINGWVQGDQAKQQVPDRNDSISNWDTTEKYVWVTFAACCISNADLDRNKQHLLKQKCINAKEKEKQ